MQTEIVRIGNSKGVRIPVYILKECNIRDKIEITVQDGKIIISPVAEPRNSWCESFKGMHEDGEDKLIVNENVRLEEEDWEW
jgi:antitoxin MazE